eukprot:m.100506 g.100506  ORF g.100506 m.100506 type:complete len:142 (+) comp13175_c0_seq4:2984-3409(+)
MATYFISLCAYNVTANEFLVFARSHFSRHSTSLRGCVTDVCSGHRSLFFEHCVLCIQAASQSSTLTTTDVAQLFNLRQFMAGARMVDARGQSASLLPQTASSQGRTHATATEAASAPSAASSAPTSAPVVLDEEYDEEDEE